MSKDFNSWNTLKQELDGLHKPPYFKEREIWWCSVGLNVGYEIFGKDDDFTRPVLVLKKYSHLTSTSISNQNKVVFCLTKGALSMLADFIRSWGTSGKSVSKKFTKHFLNTTANKKAPNE